MKLYKVLIRRDGKLFSPFQNYEYEPGKEYICTDFDSNPSKDCSNGFYAVGIDGIIYSFRNLLGFEVWECEVSGRSVEIDQFKRRYERIKLVRQVSLDEVRQLAEAEEEKVGYKLAEALFPINPLKIKAGPVTDEEIELLKKWASVRDSVGGSVWRSVRDNVGDNVGSNVWDSVEDSVWDSVGDRIRSSVWDSVGDRIRSSVWDSVENSVYDSVRAYISSLFPGIKKWKYIDHNEGENPFQPCIDLWHRGFMPSYGGRVWRLHAGEKAEIVWEGEIDHDD
jgi:hypothetical protein